MNLVPGTFQRDADGLLFVAKDTPIPFERPRRMITALQTAGVQVSSSWFPDYTHDS
jgi:hypothetical protein